MLQKALKPPSRVSLDSERSVITRKQRAPQAWPRTSGEGPCHQAHGGKDVGAQADCKEDADEQNAG